MVLINRFGFVRQTDFPPSVEFSGVPGDCHSSKPSAREFSPPKRRFSSTFSSRTREEDFPMRAFRVIFLTSLLFFLAGGAFAQSNKSYSAPDFDFSGPMKTELLLIVVGAALLLARRRGGRAVSQTQVLADEPRYTVKVREVVGAEAAPENNRSLHRSAQSFVDFN
jgi:hypothetical protein